MNISVMHVMNSINPTSNEYELASHLDRSIFDVTMVSFMSSLKVIDERIVDLNAKNKLDPYAIYKLGRLMRSRRFDILHTHHNISGSIARVLARKNGIPVIVDTEHGSHRTYKFGGNVFNDVTLFTSDRIVNVSEWVRDSYGFWERLFIPLSKTCTIYNGVDVRIADSFDIDIKRKERIRKQYGIKSEHKVFLHAARLTKIKNQFNLIKGFTMAADKYRNIKLIIAGDGELRSKLEELVRHLNMSDSIIFTGLIERRQVYSLMEAVDGFVLNSQSEGLSVALLEAMSFGLPCILSRIPSFIETVKGCDIGEFIHEDSIEKVEEAFERFIETDEKDLQEKGNRARELARTCYDIKDTVKKYQELYIDLINQKCPGYCL